MTKRKYRYTPYIYLIPAFIIFILFMLYPILYNFKYSFYEWDGISTPTKFVGVANYINFFQDDAFKVIIQNTVLYAVFTVFFKAILGLLAAVFIKRITAFKSFFNTVIFLPVVMTPTVLSLVASNVFDANFGPVNVILKSLGLSYLAQPWLAQGWSALFVIFIIDIWQWSGFFTIFYSAGMTNIPEELYEAAGIDGASEFRKFFMITLPMLRSTHFSLAILSGASVLKVFDVVWVLTQGGPAGATEFFSTYILKKSYVEYNQAASSAVSMVLFALALIVTVVQLRAYNSGQRQRGVRL